MSKQSSADQFAPVSEQGKGSHGMDANASLPIGSAAEVSMAGEPAAPKKLTTEEQMALYENSLKEEDWGHQPC